MTYYEYNDFDQIYIDTYKKQITDLWNLEYNLNINENPIQSVSKQNTLTAHIFKKNRTKNNNNELETYLKDPPVNFDMDILTFWKVIL